MTAWAERMLAYVVVMDRMQAEKNLRRRVDRILELCYYYIVRRAHKLSLIAHAARCVD